MFVSNFDSTEDFFEYLRKGREGLDATVLPWQEQLVSGDKTIRFVTMGSPGKESHLVIYTSLEEPKYEEDREMYRTPSMKNMRFGTHFSRSCMEGELGDLHIATVAVKISDAVFEEFKSLGWPNDIDLIRSVIENS